jgi:hypothetical protein
MPHLPAAGDAEFALEGSPICKPAELSNIEKSKFLKLIFLSPFTLGLLLQRAWKNRGGLNYPLYSHSGFHSSPVPKFSQEILWKNSIKNMHKTRYAVT